MSTQKEIEKVTEKIKKLQDLFDNFSQEQKEKQGSVMTQLISVGKDCESVKSVLDSNTANDNASTKKMLNELNEKLERALESVVESINSISVPSEEKISLSVRSDLKERIDGHTNKIDQLSNSLDCMLAKFEPLLAERNLAKTLNTIEEQLEILSKYAVDTTSDIKSIKDNSKANFKNIKDQTKRISDIFTDLSNNHTSDTPSECAPAT